MDHIRQGDLVKTGDGYYAVVRAVLPEGKYSLFLGNGLHEVVSGPLSQVPFKAGCDVPCNFDEVLRPVESWELNQ